MVGCKSTRAGGCECARSRRHKGCEDGVRRVSGHKVGRGVRAQGWEGCKGTRAGGLQGWEG